MSKKPAGKAPAGKAPAGKAPAGKAPAGKAPAKAVSKGASRAGPAVPSPGGPLGDWVRRVDEAEAALRANAAVRVLASWRGRPASAETLDRIEASLGVPLDPAVRDVYSQANGLALAWAPKGVGPAPEPGHVAAWAASLELEGHAPYVAVPFVRTPGPLAAAERALSARVEALPPEPDDAHSARAEHFAALARAALRPDDPSPAVAPHARVVFEHEAPEAALLERAARWPLMRVCLDALLVAAAQLQPEERGPVVRALAERGAGVADEITRLLDDENASPHYRAEVLSDLAPRLPLDARTRARVRRARKPCARGVRAAPS